MDDSAAPVNPNSISLRPEPAPGVANQFTPILSAPGAKKDQKGTSTASSRAASETRHISISEPTPQEREGRSPLASPSENPMTLTMRQLGAEAAAKAKQGQRKPSGALAQSTAGSIPVAKPDIQPSPPPATPDASERETIDPSKEPEVTAAKMPAQLAAEGAKRTSVDKIEAATASTGAESASSATATTKAPVAVTDANPTSSSTEEQLLELRRQSTQTNVPSRLADSVSAELDNEPASSEPTGELESAKPNDEPASKEPVTAVSAADPPKTKPSKVEDDIEPPVAEALSEPPETTTSSTTSAKVPSTESSVASPTATTASHGTDSAAALASVDTLAQPAGSRPRSHRGSSVEEADVAEIRKIEEANRIDEHPEEHEEAVGASETSRRNSASNPTEAAEKPEEKLIEGKKPQETAAKDPEAAKLSVED